MITKIELIAIFLYKTPSCVCVSLKKLHLNLILAHFYRIHFLANNRINKQLKLYSN